MNKIKGIVAVISNYGVGKTTFALECRYHPRDIIFINDDVKEPFDNEDDGLKEQDFGLYVNLVSQSSDKTKLLEFHQHCNNLIETLPESKVIIWDTWTQYQATFPAYVKANLNQFRNPKEWSAMGKIKSGEIYNDAYRYEGLWLTKLKSKCELLILTFHLKQHYMNGVAVPNKFKPGHDRAIEKYADMRIWLTPNLESQVPTGLVLKNISRRQVTEQGIQTSQVLPLKISHCNWNKLLYYWNTPLGDRELEEYERPNSFELSLIEGTLTPEDKRLYEASLSLVEKQEAEQEKERLLLEQRQEKAIITYIAENFEPGTAGPVIVAGLTKAIEIGELIYDGEINNGKVMNWS
jgi:hypothetical protein